jgi:hypothetical protein
MLAWDDIELGAREGFSSKGFRNGCLLDIQHFLLFSSSFFSTVLDLIGWFRSEWQDNRRYEMQKHTRQSVLPSARLMRQEKKMFKLGEKKPLHLHIEDYIEGAPYVQGSQWVGKT